MTPERRRCSRRCSHGPRRSAAAAFNILLRSPDLAQATQLVGLEVRYNSSIRASSANWRCS